MQSEADKERSEIVAWLRAPGRDALIPMPDRIIPSHWETDDCGNRWRVPQHIRKMSRLPNSHDLADAIEALAHKGKDHEG